MRILLIYLLYIMEFVQKKISEKKYTPQTKERLLSTFANVLSEYKTGKSQSIFATYRQQMQNNTFKLENTIEIIAQLTKDKIAFDSNEPVSECGYFAPRHNGKNKLKRAAIHKIIDTMFPYEDEKKFTQSKMQYAKLILQLTHRFLDEQLSKQMDKYSYKLVRLNEYKDLWESLKKSDFYESIKEPSAMPVEIAEKEDLEEFFNFLAADMEIEKDKVLDYDSEWLSDEKCLKFTRGAVYTDGRMDLCKQVVGPTWISGLMTSLVENTQITHFLLGNNIIGTVGANAIKKFLLNKHAPKLETWYLAGNDINSEGIEYLVDGLENDPDCTELWLKRNPIKPEGMKHIRRLLEKNTNIVTLDLNNVAAFDSGCKELFEGLKSNTTLKSLYLDANGITSKGATYIAEYFKYLNDTGKEGLVNLWIGMNRIYDDGLKEIMTELKNYKYIERFCVSSDGLSEISAKEIYEACKDHPSLISLDLGMYKSTADMGELTNKMGDEGADYFVKLIKENKKIQYLSLLHNDISDEKMDEIASALDHNNTLLHLDYKQYFTRINEKTKNAIINKISMNRKKNGITNDDATTHRRFLRHTKEIVRIDSIYRNNM